MSGFGDWESELCHYGILGMKWGVRRYQNKDGTLTAAGKRHARVKDMSDSELESRIKRLRMEDEYRKLNKSGVTRAFEYVRAYNKERAENKQKKAALLTAKAANKAKNPFYISANKLAEGIGTASGKFVDKTLNALGDQLIGDLPEPGTMKKAAGFVANKVKDKWNSGKDARQEAKRQKKLRKEYGDWYNPELV